MSTSRIDPMSDLVTCSVDADATLAEIAAALTSSGALAATVFAQGQAIGAVTAQALLAHWPHHASARHGRAEPPSGLGFADEPE